jgi:hypothetical protein
VVVDDATEAQGLLRKGVDVVLIAAPGTPSPQLENRVPGRELPGRLAILVGDASRADVLEAAREMDRELFGRPGPAGLGSASGPAGLGSASGPAGGAEPTIGE